MARRRLLFALVLLAACNRGDSSKATTRPGGSSAAPEAPPDTASDAGAKAARALVGARSLDEAIAVTRDVVTRGGLVLVDSTGRRAAAVPVSPVRIVAPELVQLAAEARRRPTMSHLRFDQLADLLGDMGFPWREDAARDEQFRQVVRAWVREAQRRPDDPRNFTPLFLADMARRQRPAVDLAADEWNARDLRLTFLEVQLIIAELAGRYDLPAGRASAAPQQGGIRPGDLPVRFASYAAPAGAAGFATAKSVCDDAKEWFGANLGTQLLGTYGQWGISEGLKKGLSAAGLGDEVAGKVGTALDAVGAALKLVKMAQIYSEGEVALSLASENPAHRPAPEGEGRVVVVAKAGVDEEAYQDYERKLKDAALRSEVRGCLETLGLPSWSELGDIAKEAETWIVRWDVTRGAPTHVEFINRENDWYLFGQLGMKLKRASPSTAEAKLTLRLVPETVQGHPEPTMHDQAVVQAAVDVSQMPGISVITDVMIGGVVGLGKSLVEVGVGWFEAMVPIKSSIAVPVVYHVRGIPFYIEHHSDGDMSMRGIIGFKNGRMRTQEHWSGSLAMSPDSVWRGQLWLTSEGVYRIPDAKKMQADGKAIQRKVESSRMEEVFTGAMEMIVELANVPGCSGRYTGLQEFKAEGWPEVDEAGKTTVVVTLEPAAEPAYWASTSACPWSLNESGGEFKVLPSRYLMTSDPKLSIPVPVAGQKQVLREGVNLKGLQTSATITIGGEPD